MQISDRPTSSNYYPVLWLATYFAAGILLAKSVAVEIGFAVILAATCALTLAALVLSKHGIATLFISLAFMSAGVLSYQSEQKLNSSPNRIKNLYDSGVIGSGTPVEIEGILNGAPEAAFDGAFLNLRTNKLSYKNEDRNVTGNVRIFVPTRDLGRPDAQAPILGYGSRIRAACRLEREDEYLNPGVVPRRVLLDRLNIDATCFVKSPMLVTHLGQESVFLPLAWVYNQHANLIDDFRAHLSPKNAGVVIASLLGNKNFLDKDTADLFRDGGTFHVLVISGAQITFIGGLIYLLVRRLTRREVIRFGITNAVLWAYTLAVGADIPVVRAAVMFTVISFSYLIYRQSNLLNSLGLSCLILLVWRPSDLFNPSFQLTTVSVAAIITCAFPLITKLGQIGEWVPTSATPFPPNVSLSLKRFCEMLYWRPAKWTIEQKRQIWTAQITKTPYFGGKIGELSQKALRYIVHGLLVSLIVQIWLLPLTVVYFHRVSFSSILLNLWVGIFLACVSLAAIAAAVAGYFSELLATGFYAIADVFHWLLLVVPSLFSDSGWASFRTAAYTDYGRVIYAIYFVPIILLATAVNRWEPFDFRQGTILTSRRVTSSLVLGLIVLAGVIVFHPLSLSPPDGRLHVDFIDVGQGDAIFVTFPNGQTMLIDGGGRPVFRKADYEFEQFEPDVRRVGETVVSEVLWAKGYSRIDYILATHADTDHIQGLVDVAKNFRPNVAFTGRIRDNDASFVELYEVLQQQGIPLQTIIRGDILMFDDASVEVLHPTASHDENATSENDNSIVLRIVYGTRAFLLTADIERAAETALLANGSALTADVVKVAHHGSRTSSMQQFIDATRAKYAVISVGRSSPFGHPHPEVVARWQAAGAEVFTTGQNGMLSISTDGKDLKIKSFQQ